MEQFYIELATSVAGGFAFLAVAWMVATSVERLVRRWVGKRFRVDPATVAVIARTSRIAIVSLSVIVLLDALGTDIASLLAALGIFGFAIAIGLRSSLTNLFTGAFILVLKPYVVGEYIAGERIEGIVESISLFHTDVVTPGGVLVAIPNGAMWTTRSVKNFSRIRQKRVNLELTVERSLPYSEMRAVIEKIVRADPAANSGLEPQVRIEEVLETSMELRVSTWCDAEHTWDLGKRLSEALRDALESAGIRVIDLKVTQKASAAPKKAAAEPKEPAATEETPPDGTAKVPGEEPRRLESA